MKRRGFIQALGAALVLPAGALVELPRRRVYSFPSRRTIKITDLPPSDKVPGAFAYIVFASGAVVDEALSFYALNFSGFVVPTKGFVHQPTIRFCETRT